MHTGEKIVHCHVEGMGTGVHKHLLPWEGDMDLQGIVNALKEIEFSGKCIEYLRDLVS